MFRSAPRFSFRFESAVRGTPRQGYWLTTVVYFRYDHGRTRKKSKEQ